MSWRCGLARAATASQLERIVRAYRPAQVMNELAEANERHRGRRVSWSWDDDGSQVVSARLSPEDGAVFLEALEAGRDAVRFAPGDMGDDVSAETSHPAAGNADAFVGVARLALSAVDRDDRGDAPYQVVVHVDAAGPEDPDNSPALRRALWSRDGGCRLAPRISLKTVSARSWNAFHPQEMKVDADRYGHVPPRLLPAATPSPAALLALLPLIPCQADQSLS